MAWMSNVLMAVYARVIALLTTLVKLADEKTQLSSRVDKVQYTLACDDEYNFRHNEKPCRVFRLKKSIKAFISNQ